MRERRIRKFCLRLGIFMRSDLSEPRVMTCLYDLTLWYIQRTNRFPRNWRISLGDHIDRLLLEMLGLAQQARMRSKKVTLLYELSEKVEILRSMTRLCRDLKCLELSQYEFVSRQIDEIGRQLGGWIKQQEPDDKPRSRRGDTAPAETSGN